MILLKKYNKNPQSIVMVIIYKFFPDLTSYKENLVLIKSIVNNNKGSDIKL